MSFRQCKRCRKFKFNPEDCSCKLFIAWLKEDGDEEDGRHVFATDNKSAAEEFARKDDADGEYHIVTLGHANVMVRDNQTQEVFEFEIEAYPELVYNASVC